MKMNKQERLKELIRLGYLDEKEAKVLNRLAYLAYERALASFGEQTIMNPELSVVEHIESEFFKLLNFLNSK